MLRSPIGMILLDGRQVVRYGAYYASLTVTASKRPARHDGKAGEWSRPSIIEAEGLVKHYGKVQALAGLDLLVAKGSILALLGAERSGQDDGRAHTDHSYGRGQWAEPG